MSQKATVGRAISVVILGLVVAVFSGCPEGIDADNDNGHEDAGWIEIETRGDDSELIAVWDEIDGWEDADGEAIEELPEPVVDDSGQRQPLVEGGPPASLKGEIYNPDGELVEMEVLGENEETHELDCSEFSFRYYPIEDQTEIIAWPNFEHPDTEQGRGAPHQFVEYDEEPTRIFHCDHVDVYPTRAGTVDVEFMLWHFDHADDISDPLTIRVEESG